MVWKANIITLFPELFPGPLDCSNIGRALEQGIWQVNTVNPRDFANDKHCSVDDTPAGGGAGMVLRADILGRAIDSLSAQSGPRIYMSPKGKPLIQSRIRDLATGSGVTVLCGRFEGVDQRLIDHYDIEEICLGDFILAGGEIAAMAMLEACLRLLPGVAGNVASLEDESFERGLLEYPHYTRPRIWKDYPIPEILLSGDHARMKAWRHEKAEATTRHIRPDLWQKYKKMSSS